MTIVRLKLERAAGVPQPYAQYRVDLVGFAATDSPLDLPSKAVVVRLVASDRLDANGEALVELTPTADLTPSGMVYRAEFRAPGSSRQERLVFAGFSGAGPVDATDWVTDLPGALDPTGLAVEIAARIAADLDVRADLQAIIDDLVVSGGGIPLPAVAPTPGQVLSASDDDPLTTDWIDPATGEVSQQDLDAHAVAEVTARNLAIAAAIAALLDSAPGTLDTLNELAAALGDDPNFATTLTTLIGTKLNASDPSVTNARTPTAHAASHGSAGTDPLTLTQAQITGLVVALAGLAPKAESTLTIHYTGSSEPRPAGWGHYVWRGPLPLPTAYVEATDDHILYEAPAATGIDLDRATTTASAFAVGVGGIFLPQATVTATAFDVVVGGATGIVLDLATVTASAFPVGVGGIALEQAVVTGTAFAVTVGSTTSSWLREDGGYWLREDGGRWNREA